MMRLLTPAVLALGVMLSLVASALAGEKISITLKYMDGDKLVLQVEPDARVETVKAMAGEHDKHPAEKHRLVFKGVKLDDEKTLADYNIGDGAEIHVLFRL